MKNNKFPEFHSKLEAKTKELLKQLPRSIELKDVAEATGLSASWLTDFSNGRFKHPSVGRIETLYNYLNKTPLEV